MSLFSKSINDTGLLSGAVDTHSHILYGLDDGVNTLDKSLSILSYLEEQGLSELWLTPHIMEDMYPNQSAVIESRFEELKSSYSGSIELHLAAEYMLDNLYAQRLRSDDLLCHGDATVLVEMSSSFPPINMWQLIDYTMSQGYYCILAHPERYLYLSEGEYKKLKSKNVRFQLNLGSIVGYYGSQVKKRAEALLEDGRYEMFGSDCHRLRTLEHILEMDVLKSGVVKSLEKLRDNKI